MQSFGIINKDGTTRSVTLEEYLKVEIARCHRQAREATRQILRASVLLVLFKVPEFFGSRAAHQAADDQRDIIGERRYARQEFRMNAGRYEAMINPDSDPDDWEQAFE
jgi:hypothetical protein